MKKFVAIALALVFALAVVGCAKETDIHAKSEGTMTHEEYVAAELESAVVVVGFVQDNQSWWRNPETGEETVTVYLQDQDGGYFVYNLACSEEDAAKLEKGTKIKVSGYKTEWSGEVEIVDGTFEFMEGNWVAEAMDVTPLLDSAALIDHQNEFVSFKGMTVAPSYNADGEEVAYLYKWDGSGQEGDDLYFNVSLNGNTYNFVVESYLCDSSTEVYSAVKALEVGQTVDMEGFLYWYEGANPHITSVTVK